VTEPVTFDLGIICDEKTIYTMKEFTVKAEDYVDITLTIDMAELSAKLGAGDHRVSIAVITPVYKEGKFLYDDVSKKATYNLGTGEKGATFKLSKGLSGSAVTNTYLYAGSQTYGVKYFFTLETGKYGGDYTMSFPAEDGTDNRTFTVEPNSIYHITYTYGIDYSATYSYDYKFSVNLTGPQAATLSFNSKHPGKINIGNFQIEKQP
jgi:hypothetical protein